MSTGHRIIIRSESKLKKENQFHIYRETLPPDQCPSVFLPHPTSHSSPLETLLLIQVLIQGSCHLLPSTLLIDATRILHGAGEELRTFGAGRLREDGDEERVRDVGCPVRWRKEAKLQDARKRESKGWRLWNRAKLLASRHWWRSESGTGRIVCKRRAG